MGLALARGREGVTGDDQGSLSIWNTRGELLDSFPRVVGGIRSVFLDRDAKRILATCLDSKAYLVDRDTGAVLQSFSGHQGTVVHAAFSPDEKRIATTSGDKTIRVFDVATGEQRLLLRGHQAATLRVAFLSDSRIVSSSSDGTVRFWHLDHVGLAAAVEAVQIRELTDEERRRFEALIR